MSSQAPEPSSEADADRLGHEEKEPQTDPESPLDPPEDPEQVDPEDPLDPPGGLDTPPT